MSAPEITAPKRELSRHMTADGRNSLKKHLIGGRETSIATTWYSKILKKETIPLIAAVGGGVLLAGWFGIRHLTTSPDVRINKVQRQQTIRENQTEGKNWVKHRESLRNASPVQYVEKVEKP